jgi:26S proteasome regulatory subunit N12
MKREAASQSMDSELEDATCKLAWLNFAFARGDIDSCVALLSELKVHFCNPAQLAAVLSPDSF